MLLAKPSKSILLENIQEDIQMQMLKFNSKIFAFLRTNPIMNMIGCFSKIIMRETMHTQRFYSSLLFSLLVITAIPLHAEDNGNNKEQQPPTTSLQQAGAWVKEKWDRLAAGIGFAAGAGLYVVTHRDSTSPNQAQQQQDIQPAPVQSSVDDSNPQSRVENGVQSGNGARNVQPPTERKQNITNLPEAVPQVPNADQNLKKSWKTHKKLLSELSPDEVVECQLLGLDHDKWEAHIAAKKHGSPTTTVPQVPNAEQNRSQLPTPAAAPAPQPSNAPCPPPPSAFNLDQRALLDKWRATLSDEEQYLFASESIQGQIWRAQQWQEEQESKKQIVRKRLNKFKLFAHALAGFLSNQSKEMAKSAGDSLSSLTTVAGAPRFDESRMVPHGPEPAPQSLTTTHSPEILMPHVQLIAGLGRRYQALNPAIPQMIRENKALILTPEFPHYEAVCTALIRLCARNSDFTDTQDIAINPENNDIIISGECLRMLFKALQQTSLTQPARLLGAQHNGPQDRTRHNERKVLRAEKMARWPQQRSPTHNEIDKRLAIVLSCQNNDDETSSVRVQYWVGEVQRSVDTTLEALSRQGIIKQDAINQLFQGEDRQASRVVTAPFMNLKRAGIVSEADFNTILSTYPSLLF